MLLTAALINQINPTVFKRWDISFFTLYVYHVVPGVPRLPGPHWPGPEDSGLRLLLLRAPQLQPPLVAGARGGQGQGLHGEVSLKNVNKMYNLW